MKEAFKRAIALITVGLVLLIWTLMIYFAGFSRGISYTYPDYLSPQKGPNLEDSAPGHRVSTI